MPEIRVWPVSTSVCTRNVGSSCASLAERGAHLFLVRLGFRLDGNRNHRRREIDGFEHDGLVFVAQRVAGGDVLQAHARGNIARFHRFDFFALVGMHPQQAADALARLLASSCKRICPAFSTPE